VPLLRSTDPLRKNDVLASNLLFITLAISVAEQLFWLAFAYWDQVAYVIYVMPGTSSSSRVVWQLLPALLQAAFYYAIRRGMFRAKVVVLLVCIYLAYKHIYPYRGYFTVVHIADLWGYPVLVLLKDLLTLAALVLMFKKPQLASSDT
jgi:hypothetical protein